MGMSSSDCDENNELEKRRSMADSDSEGPTYTECPHCGRMTEYVRKFFGNGFKCERCGKTL